MSIIPLITDVVWKEIFFRFSGKNPEPRELLYFMIKRLKMQPSEVKALSRDDRNWLYQREYAVYKKELAEIEKNKGTK